VLHKLSRAWVGVAKHSFSFREPFFRCDAAELGLDSVHFRSDFSKLGLKVPGFIVLVIAQALDRAFYLFGALFELPCMDLSFAELGGITASRLLTVALYLSAFLALAGYRSFAVPLCFSAFAGLWIRAFSFLAFGVGRLRLGKGHTDGQADADDADQQGPTRPDARVAARVLYDSVDSHFQISFRSPQSLQQGGLAHRPEAE
jgi:hypothetical protein